MPLLFFPFRYGSIPAPVVAPPAVPPLWGNVTVAAQHWLESTPPQRVPRLERVYDQKPRQVDDQVNFAHRVTSQFPFICATGNQVYLFSTITKRGPT